jgi:glycosyltransferase involved in cell wall biosynthesis
VSIAVYRSLEELDDLTGVGLERVVVALPKETPTREIDLVDRLQRHGRVTEIARTDDGDFVAAMVPCKRRGEVAIWTGYAIGPWHPTDITRRGLGGSETAACRLAEELASMGYTVTLYGQFEGQDGLFGDVITKSFDRFDPTQPLTAFVGFRNAQVFDLPINAQWSCLWLEDLPGAEQLNQRRAEKIDAVCTVSRWHKASMHEFYPWLPDEQVVACRNGITHRFFQPDHPPEREKRVLFTSSPDRGLDVMLEIWPRVREQVPDATFVSTYSRWYDLVAEHFPAARPFRRHLEQLGKQPGVSRIKGGLGQGELAHLMMSSMVWAHPSWYADGGIKFCETSCISAMEAQAAGCVVVAANWGALQETVQVGTKIDGDPSDPDGEFRDRLVSGIVQGLTNETVQIAAQIEGPEAVRNCDWRGAAEQLAGLFEPAVNGRLVSA